MARRYLVVSDLHLCDIEDHNDGWKLYKNSRFVYDHDFAEMVQAFLDEAHEHDECTLILNGDIIDFDLLVSIDASSPGPMSLREKRVGLAATGPKSAWKLQKVLDDHALWLETLVRFLHGGHHIVFVMGNHDREFHFVEVQNVLMEALRHTASGLGVTFDSSQFVFEPWFHYVPGDIYVEHGQQYDYYNSFQFVLAPTVSMHKEQTLALPMGNLSNRRLMSRMGYFNPHATDYILNIYRYLAHWLRYYAFSRRSLLFTWILGSPGVLLELLHTKDLVRRHPPDYSTILSEYAERKKLSKNLVKNLDRLKRSPITNRVYRMVREFWIDRVILSAALAGTTLILALVPIPMWIKFMLPLSTFPLLFVIYEWFAYGETVHTFSNHAVDYAREIGSLVDAKVVTFGHSHKPEVIPL